MNKTTSLAATAFMLSACAAPQAPEQPENPPKVGIANPASVYCIQQGGKLRMVQTAQGTHAICILPSGQEVEEWEYFRKNHPAKP